MNSGDSCPNCPGVLQVVNTRIVGQTRRRYIGCRGCGYRSPEPPQTVPLSEAPKQRPRAWQMKRIEIARLSKEFIATVYSINPNDLAT